MSWHRIGVVEYGSLWKRWPKVQNVDSIETGCWDCVITKPVNITFPRLFLGATQATVFTLFIVRLRVLIQWHLVAPVILLWNLTQLHCKNLRHIEVYLCIVQFSAAHFPSNDVFPWFWLSYCLREYVLHMLMMQVAMFVAVTVLCMPMALAQSMNRLWFFGAFLCKFTNYMQGECWLLSRFRTTAITSHSSITLQKCSHCPCQSQGYER